MPSTLLRDAWRDLATRALGVVPVRVCGPADSSDVAAYIKDLELVEQRILLPVLRAYADFATDNFPNVHHEELLAAFERIADAFGDLRGHLYDAEQQMMEAEEDYDADPRGWEKARELGVD